MAGIKFAGLNIMDFSSDKRNSGNLLSEDIIGTSDPMQDVFTAIINAAETNANVVIYGESGTGKELVAREIHRLSSRDQNNFVPVNCGAIPENIIESEFFGYKKGAFTGAYTDKQGYLDFAHCGTLFLDEIGEINPVMQVKLLRVLDSGDYTPLGSTLAKKTDMRLIAATNRDLKKFIRRGIIREDFYYRVHIIPIHLPPLRERKNDIPLLIDHFLHLYGGTHKKIDPSLIDRCKAYEWPGNVRELQNVVHRFISMDRLDFSGSPRKTEKNKQPETNIGVAGNLAELMSTYEKEIIKNTLIKFQWHRGRAAEALGINRKTLFTKISKYGLKKPHA